MRFIPILMALVWLVLSAGMAGAQTAPLLSPPPPVDLDAPAGSQKERIADRLNDGGRFALIIGVREFRSLGWKRLEGVEKEIDDVSAILHQHGFEIDLLKGDASATTKARVNGHLNEFIARRRAGDRVVIYVASHGLAIPSRPDGEASAASGESIGYVIASDTLSSSEAGFAGSAISVADIREKLEALPSQHVMVAFNTCFSGSLVPSTRAQAHRPDLPQRPDAPPLAAEVLDWVSTLLAGRARHFLTAGDAGQTVPDVENPFGRAFVEGLLGAADSDGDGLILASELGQFVRSRVALETRRAGRPNDPLFITSRNAPGVKDGEFVFLSPRGPAGSDARKDGPALERRRAGLPGGQFTDCLDCPVMVDLGQGQGQGQGQSQGQRQTEANGATTAPRVALGRTEVTVAEWSACFRAGQCRRWKSDAGGSGQPATGVNWRDALDYVDYLNASTRGAGRCLRYRLPEAVEWSYAARGGVTTRYPWGEKADAGRAVCRGCGSPYDGLMPAAAASFSPNGYGIHDMIGNVWEWLRDDACTHEAYVLGKCGAGPIIGGGFSTDLDRIDLLQPVPVPRHGPRGGLHEPGWPSIGLRVACELDRSPADGSN